MSEATFASLNPALLARKGGAKPAMRPQLTNLPDAGTPANLEDLGWNDMGQDADDDQPPANVVQLTPATADDLVEEEGGETPDVVRQQKELVERIAEKPAKAHAAATPAKKRKAAKAVAKSKGRRAAFTLRLDPARHLKLRLASTMQGVSAQAFVTDALDAMLDEIDDLDALAAKMQRD